MLLSLLRAAVGFWPPRLMTAAAASAMDAASASEAGAAAASASGPACSGLEDLVSLLASRCRMRSRMTVLKLLLLPPLLLPSLLVGPLGLPLPP